MARLAGVDIPREKRVIIALTYIFGVGKTRAEQTIAATGVNPDTRVKDLSDAELVQLRDYIEGNFKVEGDPRGAAHGLRPSDPGRGDQGVHGPA